MARNPARGIRALASGVRTTPARPILPPDCGDIRQGPSRAAVCAREFVMKKMIGLALVAAAFTLAACNTVKGVGRDIESVGSAGEKAINQ